MRYDANNGITVMLIDTNVKFLEYFYRFLNTKLPFNFIPEKNGTRALLTADKTPVHLFLMEAKLTEQVSGYKILELIKSDDKLKDIPVIFVSSLRDKVSVAKAKALGVNDYLQKPIVPEEIFERTIKFLSQYLKFKILIVDYEEKHTKAAMKVIKSQFPYKCEILTANSAPSAMEIIDTQEINLLIVGNNMPIVSGVRMLAMLNDQEKLSKLGVVFCPEELSVEDRGTLGELGIEHYAEKPYTGALVETAMNALNIKPLPEIEDLEQD